MPPVPPAYDLKTSPDSALEAAAKQAETRGDKKNLLKNIVVGGIAAAGIIFAGAAVTLVGGAAGVITMFGTCLTLGTGLFAVRPLLEQLDAAHYAEYNRIHDELDARKAARFVEARKKALAAKPTPDTPPARQDFTMAARRRVGAMKPVRFRRLGFSVFS